MLSPDRQMIVYLRLKAGDKLAGHTWNVSPEMKGGPQVMKLWKPDPRLQPKTQSYSTGYAMKLELGKIAKGELSGKIFLALPDAEQSVIGGVFEAETKLPDTVEAPVATPAGSAAPQKPPPAHP